MIDFKVTLDTREFDRAFEQYLELNTKRTVEDIANTTVYFVARNAVNTTIAATPEEIREDLMKPSAVAPNAPIAAILVQKQRQAKGKTKGSRKGLHGAAMAAAIEKLIKARINVRNFLRSGWIWSIKQIEPFIKQKSGAPRYERVKIKGSPKGGGKVARVNSFWRATAEIWNSVQGGKTPSPRVLSLLMEGLQRAIDLEATSKMEYNARKMVEKGINNFNRS